jgi:hypothetical protein
MAKDMHTVSYDPELSLWAVVCPEGYAADWFVFEHEAEAHAAALTTHDAREPRTAAASYFYRPIAFYDGTVLKCAGIADDTNRSWFMAQHPDAIELDGYRGDRIRASDHTLFER